MTMTVKCPGLHLTLKNVGDTDLLGRWLGQQGRIKDVILLSGDLAAGKTTMTQSIARGLEVPEDQYVTSPSFALLHEYQGRIPLYHMDCYRLSGEDDVEGAGLIDYIGGSGLTVIEWPDRLGSLCPEQHLDISLTRVDESKRTCSIMFYGSSWENRFRQLTTWWHQDD